MNQKLARVVMFLCLPVILVLGTMGVAAGEKHQPMERGDGFIFYKTTTRSPTLIATGSGQKAVEDMAWDTMKCESNQTVMIKNLEKCAQTNMLSFRGSSLAQSAGPTVRYATERNFTIVSFFTFVCHGYRTGALQCLEKEITRCKGITHMMNTLGMSFEQVNNVHKAVCSEASFANNLRLLTKNELCLEHNIKELAKCADDVLTKQIYEGFMSALSNASIVEKIKESKDSELSEIVELAVNAVINILCKVADEVMKCVLKMANQCSSQVGELAKNYYYGLLPADKCPKEAPLSHTSVFPTVKAPSKSALRITTSVLLWIGTVFNFLIM